MSDKSESKSKEPVISNITDVDKKLDELCSPETASDIKNILHIFDLILIINESNFDEIFNQIKQYKHDYTYLVNFIKYAKKIRPKQINLYKKLLFIISDKLMFDVGFINWGYKPSYNLYDEYGKEIEGLDEIIINDDVDQFIKITEINCIDLNSKMMNFHTLINFDKDNESIFVIGDDRVSINQLIAYYGSAKCFKYALLSGSLKYNEISDYAIAGGNIEIIHILEQEGVRFDECFRISLIFHRDTISDWLLKNYECHNHPKDYGVKCHNIRAMFYLFRENINEMASYSIKNSAFELTKYFVEEKGGGFFDESNTSKEINEIIKRKSMLHRACFDGDLPLVKKLVKEDENFCVDQLYNGSTPLRYATLSNNIEVAMYLINECCANVDISFYDEEEKQLKSVLLSAIENDNLEFTKYLIEECNARTIFLNNNLNISSLSFACAKNKIRIFYYLVENLQFSQNELNSAFGHACIENSIEIAKFLFAEGNIIQNSVDLSLVNVSIKNHLELAKFLVEECHANIEFVLNNHTPIYFACSNSSFEVAKYLFEECHAETRNIPNSVLFKVLESNRNDFFIYLIENIHLNANEFRFGRNLLHTACYLQNMEIIKFLANVAKIDINQKNSNSETALHIACKLQNMEIIKFLVSEGHADIEVENIDRKTALIEACFKGTMEQRKFLIEHHAKVNIKQNGKIIYSALHIACNNEDLEFVKYLIKTCPEDVRESIELPNRDNVTILYEACKNGHLDIAKCLIIDGHANVNIKGHYNISILHILCYSGSFELSKYLIEKCNVSVYEKDDDGNDAFLFACQGGNLELIKYLVDNFDIDPKEKGKYGNTALHFASRKGTLDVYKYLIDVCHISVDDKDIDGATALQYVCNSNNLEVTKYLIEECNADIHVSNKMDQKLIHYVDTRNLEMLKYLIEDLKLNARERDKKGRTILYNVVLGNITETMNYLVHNGYFDQNDIQEAKQQFEDFRNSFPT